MQCHKATTKAMRFLGLIKRTFKHLNLQSLPFLYKIILYVPPHFEYYVPVWSPCLGQDMNKLQRRSTKLIRDISRLPYEDRLKHLYLPSLYASCLRGDLIEILKGFTDIDANILFRKSTNDRTRQHSLKQCKKKFTTNICKNFFLTELSTRGINYPNML